MFGEEQKSDLEKLIDKDGIEYVAKKFSEIILQKMPTKEIAYQFVLEEIEAASKGNDAAISFARNSGISPQECEGAMMSSRPEVDGPDGPQQFLLFLCMQLKPNGDLVVEFRTKIVDNIMKALSFGKYKNHTGKVFYRKKHSKNESLNNFVEKKNNTDYIFININNDLGDAVEPTSLNDWPPLMFMAYGYARRAAVTALYIQGIVEEDVYEHVKTIFKVIQNKTGHSVEFQEKAVDISIEFMKGYSPVITKLLIKKMAIIAKEYEFSTEKLSDADLFRNVADVIYFEQNEHRTKAKSEKIQKPELTSPLEPTPELQSVQGVHNYLARLSSFDYSTLCVEFSNVRAAKHNLRAVPANCNNFQEVQTLVTDLTDKSAAICMFVFGKPAVWRYNGDDLRLRSFNRLVNEIDAEVAKLDLEPEQHGEQLLKRLGSIFKQRVMMKCRFNQYPKHEKKRN